MAPPDVAAGDPRLASLDALYPALAGMPDALRRAGLAHATLARAPAGALLFDAGAPCGGFPMVLSGEVRVCKTSADGRSLELYRVGPGELCVASTGASLGDASLAAQGTAVQDCELLLLGQAGLQAWLQHAPFRTFVFGLFAERLADLMALVEAVAFHRLDARLAAALLGHGAVLHLTHQALADELGTVREIVSRLLKRFERAGWIEIQRERIVLKDAPALRSQAAR